MLSPHASLRSRTKNNLRLYACQIKDKMPHAWKGEQIQLSLHAWGQGQRDEQHSCSWLEAEYGQEMASNVTKMEMSNPRLTCPIWIGWHCYTYAWVSHESRSKLRMMRVKIAFFALYTFTNWAKTVHNCSACLCNLSNIEIRMAGFSCHTTIPNH